MRLLRGKHRRATIWLLAGLLGWVGIAVTAWQYDRAARQARLNRNLIDAITDGRVYEVQTLLREGADPDARELPDTTAAAPWKALFVTMQRLWRHQPPAPRQINPTALLVAVQCEVETRTSEAAVVQALLDHGANPDALMPGTSAGTPLFWAVQDSQIQTIRLLLDKKASVQCRNEGSENGDTLLHIAIEHSNSRQTYDIVALLLSHGIDANAQNAAGETPLMTAASVTTGLPLPLLKLLLAHGADITARDHYGETALFKYAGRDADEAGGLETLTTLLDARADVNAKNRNGTTPLMEATYYGGNLALAKLLLAHGANIFLRDNRGKTALVYAAHPTQLKMVALLLRAGANINDTGFAEALLESDPSPHLVHFLRQHGANLNIKGRQGMTPLMACSQTENPDAARMLLAQGAAVNARDDYGQTALMFAANDGHLAVAQLLLAHGASKSARDLKGRTNLDRPRKGLFDTDHYSSSSDPALGRKFTQLFEQYP